MAGRSFNVDVVVNVIVDVVVDVVVEVEVEVVVGMVDCRSGGRVRGATGGTTVVAVSSFTPTFEVSLRNVETIVG